MLLAIVGILTNLFLTGLIGVRKNCITVFFFFLHFFNVNPESMIPDRDEHDLIDSSLIFGVQAARDMDSALTFYEEVICP